MPIPARTVAVSTEAGLNAALLDAATTANQGLIEIDIAGRIVEDADPTAIDLAAGNTLLIKGVTDPNGVAGTLDGAGAHRGLFAYQGEVTIQDLTIQNTLAQGGAGGSDADGGGGGGAGLGGGLFVAGTTAGAGTGARVTLSNVSFGGSHAMGGRGGSAAYQVSNRGGGGGGGGLGGNAGVKSGGGIGGGASGGSANGAGTAGIVPGASGGGASGAEPDPNSYGDTIAGAGGGSNGGGGGGGDTFGGGGGGGIGGGAGTTGAFNYGDGAGGAGGYGGGGGAAAGAGRTGSSGAGGFGGGGGGSHGNGGNGGFGGGGGSGRLGTPGNGGFGAGGATAYGGGGGGLGAGGAVFVQQGGSLTISGGTLSGGGVAGGTGGGLDFGQGRFTNFGADGQAYGSGLFLQGDNALTLAAGPGGTTATILDDIADQSGVSLGGGSVSVTVGGTGLPGGTVVLGGTNSYSGTTTIAAGSTLQLGQGGATGSLDRTGGIANSGTLAVDRSGHVVIATAIGGTGALVLDGGATFALTGLNTYTGGTTLRNGKLSLGSNGDLGTGSLAMAAGTGLNFSQNGLTISTALSLASAPSFDVAEGQTETLSGAISDGPGGTSGLVKKTGAGTLALSGTNTFSGGTLILNGTLRLDNAGAAGASAITFGGSAATLELAYATSNGAPLANALAGFSPGDRLELDHLAPDPAAAATVSGSTLTVTSGTASESFALAEPSEAVFAVTSDNAQGVYVTAYAKPSITGTVAGQASRNGETVDPFADVDLSDANPGATDTLTIALSGGGGTLSGDGLVEQNDGTYTLTGDPEAVSDWLQDLTFQPDDLAPGASATTTFTLTDRSSASPVAVATDATTTVLASRDAPPPADTSGSTPSQVPPAPPVTTAPATGTSPSPVATPEPATPATPTAVAPTPAVVAPATSPLAGTTARVEDIVGQPYAAVETSYDDAGRVAAQTSYNAQGKVYQQSSTEYAADGTAATMTSGGVYFARKPFFALVDRFAADGTQTEQDVFYKDGHQSVQALVQGATLGSIANDTFYTQPGGDNTFAFTAGFGHDTIASFVLGGPDHDTIQLPASAAGRLGAVLRHATADADGNAVLHLAGGDSVTVEGVSVAQLRHHPNVFGFAAG